MERELILRINGTLAPENKISLRTISHTLPHLQRAIDKIVLYEKYGEIKKHSVLPHSLYGNADLFLDPFEKGSIKIPLIGDLLEGVGSRLNQFLREPYEKAAQELELNHRPLIEQLEIVRNNIQLDNVDLITQEDLILNSHVFENSYAQTAVLKDLNNLLSPLRAKSSSEDTIEIINNSVGNTASYPFTHRTAKSFGKIISQKRLAKPVQYRGVLEGLKRTENKVFPYVGNFISEQTDEEMSLLFVDPSDAIVMNKFNLSKVKFSIWACPLAVFESFDQKRGDIVFASFVGP